MNYVGNLLVVYVLVEQSESLRDKSGPIANMVMIKDRPPKVNDRNVPRHCKGDLIIGKG